MLAGGGGYVGGDDGWVRWVLCWLLLLFDIAPVAVRLMMSMMLLLWLGWLVGWLVGYLVGWLAERGLWGVSVCV